MCTWSSNFATLLVLCHPVLIGELAATLLTGCSLWTRDKDLAAAAVELEIAAG